MSDIKPHVIALAAKLKPGLKLGEGGVIIADKDLYEQSLPDELTMDSVNAVYAHTENLVAGLTLATGEIAEEAMKKDKKLDSVSSELKIGKHAEINVGYLRSQQQRSAICKTRRTHPRRS